jgi:enoyl-CoA hydratase/carnithine racemase
LTKEFIEDIERAFKYVEKDTT